jgi:hypothetical protein
MARSAEGNGITPPQAGDSVVVPERHTGVQSPHADRSGQG